MVQLPLIFSGGRINAQDLFVVQDQIVYLWIQNLWLWQTTGSNLQVRSLKPPPRCNWNLAPVMSGRLTEDHRCCMRPLWASEYLQTLLNLVVFWASVGLPSVGFTYNFLCPWGFRNRPPPSHPIDTEVQLYLCTPVNSFYAPLLPPKNLKALYKRHEGTK